MNRWLVGGLLVAGIGVGVAWGWRGETAERTKQTLMGKDTFKIGKETPGYETYQKFKQACPARNCVPAITQPKFEGREAADSWLENDDLVLGVDYQGEHRAYPVKILNWHEVVNDEVGIPVAVTWSPLCGAAAVWDRRVEGRTLELGLSGKVENSCPVMYDRETDSLWRQVSGEAVVGEMAGKKLSQIGVETVKWQDWQVTHQGTKVLSRQTGYERDYGNYPYGSYETTADIYFPLEGKVDERVAPKTVVYGIVVGEVAKAYPWEVIEAETKEDGVLSDTVGSKRIRISNSKGSIFVEDLQSKGEILPMRMFWFAWQVVYPETEIYGL